VAILPQPVRPASINDVEKAMGGLLFPGRDSASKKINRETRPNSFLLPAKSFCSTIYEIWPRALDTFAVSLQMRDQIILSFSQYGFAISGNLA